MGFLLSLHPLCGGDLVPIVLVLSSVYICYYQQGRIQNLKKEGAQVARGRVFRHIQANLGDFLKNLAQKRVGVRPPLDPRLLSIITISIIQQFDNVNALQSPIPILSSQFFSYGSPCFCSKIGLFSNPRWPPLTNQHKCSAVANIHPIFTNQLICISKMAAQANIHRIYTKKLLLTPCDVSPWLSSKIS